MIFFLPVTRASRPDNIPKGAAILSICGIGLKKCYKQKFSKSDQISDAASSAKPTKLFRGGKPIHVKDLPILRLFSLKANATYVKQNEADWITGIF